MSRDTNFYYSFLVLPAEKRKAIVAVWDFFRAVDDTVDNPVGDLTSWLNVEIQTREALARWRRELSACYGQGVPETGEGSRLKPFVQRFSLPRQAFEAVIDGVWMDISVQRYETFDELYEYCVRVASAVGLICVEIFGYRNKSVHEYAVNLGIALQLTNIVRDIHVDLMRGRLYLPLEDLRRFGCTEGDLRAAKISKPVADLLKYECNRAREYYERARSALPPEDARRLVAAEIMGATYFSILKRIERRGYDVFSRVIFVSRLRRALITAVTWIRIMFTP